MQGVIAADLRSPHAAQPNLLRMSLIFHASVSLQRPAYVLPELGQSRTMKQVAPGILPWRGRSNPGPAGFTWLDRNAGVRIFRGMNRIRRRFPGQMVEHLSEGRPRSAQPFPAIRVEFRAARAHAVGPERNLSAMMGKEVDHVGDFDAHADQVPVDAESMSAPES